MQMTDIHYRLMNEAKRLYGGDNIEQATSILEDSFTEDDTRGVCFWFHDKGMSTHMITERQLLTDCPTCGTPLVDGRCPQPARHE